MNRISFLLACAGLAASAFGQAPVPAMVCTVESPQCSYAARRLGEALKSGGKHNPRQAQVAFEFGIDAAVGAESFSIQPQGDRIHSIGGDARGMIYGALEVREQLFNGTAIDRFAAFAISPVDFNS